MKYIYPVRFTKAKEGGYLVNYIDFDNLFTEGDTWEEAFYMAKDVLYSVLPYYQDNMPKPTLDIESINIKKDEFISLVELDTIEHERTISTKTVKTTVTMPEWLKNLADDANINFSKLLQESIKEKLNLL